MIQIIITSFQMNCTGCWAYKEFISSSACCVALDYTAEMCAKRCFDSERCQLQKAVRGELLVPQAKKATLGVKVSSTPVHLYGTHARLVTL